MVGDSSITGPGHSSAIRISSALGAARFFSFFPRRRSLGARSGGFERESQSPPAVGSGGRRTASEYAGLHAQNRACKERTPVSREEERGSVHAERD